MIGTSGSEKFQKVLFWTCLGSRCSLLPKRAPPAPSRERKALGRASAPALRVLRRRRSTGARSARGRRLRAWSQEHESKLSRSITRERRWEAANSETQRAAAGGGASIGLPKWDFLSCSFMSAFFGIECFSQRITVFTLNAFTKHAAIWVRVAPSSLRGARVGKLSLRDPKIC